MGCLSGSCRTMTHSCWLGGQFHQALSEPAEAQFLNIQVADLESLLLRELTENAAAGRAQSAWSNCEGTGSFLPQNCTGNPRNSMAPGSKVHPGGSSHQWRNGRCHSAWLPARVSRGTMCTRSSILAAVFRLARFSEAPLAISMKSEDPAGHGELFAVSRPSLQGHHVLPQTPTFLHHQLLQSTNRAALRLLWGDRGLHLLGAWRTRGAPG